MHKNQLKVNSRLTYKTWNHEIPRKQEKHREKNLLEIGLSNDFLDTTPKAQTTKVKVHMWDCIKLKSSAEQKKN